MEHESIYWLTWMASTVIAFGVGVQLGSWLERTADKDEKYCGFHLALLDRPGLRAAFKADDEMCDACVREANAAAAAKLDRYGGLE